MYMVKHMHVSGLSALMWARRSDGLLTWVPCCLSCLIQHGPGISCFLVVMSLLTYAPRMSD